MGVQVCHEFIKFINRGSVIDVAVGFIMGAIFTEVVTSFTKDLILPFVATIMGLMGIADGSFAHFFIVLQKGNKLKEGNVSEYPTLADAQEDAAVTLNHGKFIQTLLNFFLTSIAVFVILRMYKKMRGKKITDARFCHACCEEINPKATRCKHCCVDCLVPEPEIEKGSSYNLMSPA